MKRLLFIMLIFLFTGCASKSTPVIYDVAISSDSERIAYSKYGMGETSLIFIHGWSCDSRYWKKQISAFSTNYQLITVDLAGHGNSSSSRVDYTMLSFAEDIKSIIEKANIQKAILIGHSLGGAVIVEAARLMPKRVVGIIGIDTLQNVTEKIPQKTINDMTKPFEEDFTNAMQNFVLPMFPEKTDQELVTWVKEDMSSAPQKVALSAFRNYMEQYVNDAASEVFKHVTIPVLSINARLWPTNLEANKKHIQTYKLYYIEDTGHFPMLEKPKEFNTLLLEALEYIKIRINKKI